MDVNPPIERDETARGGKAAIILAAARREFLASGFGAVSMDAIAREAGVSKATVYAHFAGKEELFGAVVADVSEHHFRGFSARELDPVDVVASLTILARRFLDLVLSPEAIAVNRIIIGEAIRFPALGQVFWQAGPERTRAQIETFMRRAGDAGSLAIADARMAADQFASLVRGEIHIRHLMRVETAADSARSAEVAQSAVDVFLRAFAIRSDDQERLR